MKGSTKGFLDHRRLILPVFLLFSVVLVKPACPGDCELEKIIITKATVQDPNPDHVIYGLEGQYYPVIPGDCPPGPHNFSGKAEWFKGPPGAVMGTAYEQVGVVATRSMCTKNPWVNQDTNCLVGLISLTQHWIYNGPVPVSASAMSSAQKQTLLQLQMAKVAGQNIAAMTSGPAWEILSPKGGQQFAGDVSVHVKFRPDLGAKIKYVELRLNTNGVEMMVMGIPIQNGEAKYVLPRSKFEKYPGQWTIDFRPNPQGVVPIFGTMFKVLPTVPAIHIKKK